MGTPFKEDDLHYQLEILDTNFLMHLVFLQAYYKVYVS
jgi:hypothetical protein